MKKLLIILCFVSSIKVLSQERRAFLYASIYDEISAVSNTHIINLNTKQGTFTNDNGEFRILAKPNDSLQISFVGYETKIFKVDSNHFGIQQNKIELKKVAIELDEVEIKEHNLLGYISSDTKHIKTEKEINAESLNLPYAGSRILTPAERRWHTATTSYSGIPVDPLLNWISGRLKKLKKEKAIEDTEKRIQHIRNNYRVYILHELKIIPEDLTRFIYFIENTNNFSPSLLADEIMMISFLKLKSDEFKKLNPQNYKPNQQ
ncbi:carboxypeptidase-like regulatory domain-containing protein [Tenacibaculum sp. L6]|uniref:carboxypeptidase-like regulatory domain-containing protein n=1 Tax=Tenacibaculum sp. L6 TaxID=2992764 RepID=UPI00237BD118|nr:carboxypeptidase-like regulatory domain-containing protein [Tenacibaculum sp. L6]MDE0536746.1 carboxypeptidase-like regulatory domain-containing protein [Tenacibaculum sp. L6]